MSSTTTRRWILLGSTHLLAIAAGVVMFRSIPALSVSLSLSPSSEQLAPVELASTPADTAPKDQAPAASAHEAAWRALASQGLPRAERRRAGAIILREWIQADWHAALDAVMKEDSADGVFLGEFYDCFVRNPVASWELIEKQAYGIRTHALQRYWVEALSRAGGNRQARQELIASLPRPAQSAIQSAR